MGFYEQISKYYDEIFPVGAEQLGFLTGEVGSSPKRVLDIACGSGGYSVALAKQGHIVTAVDVDEKMVFLAQQKASTENLKVQVFRCDMKELKSRVEQKEGFDFVFCIGNSIVHLGSPEEIQEALKQMYSVMSSGAKLVLQIINFDRIIKYNITELPTLKNSETGLEFNRNYVYKETEGLIDFNTVLTVCKDDQKEHFENSIELLPLLSGDLLKMLEIANFKRVEAFGDFKSSAFDEQAFLLVIKAEKQ